MDKYISIQVLREAFEEEGPDIFEDDGFALDEQGYSCEAFNRIVEQLPAADVAPVVHGRWKYKEGAAYCTACKRQTDPRNYGYPHCPLCGAPMDGKE